MQIIFFFSFLKELTESLSIFIDINKTFVAAKFPLPYLGIGKVFVKQNR